MYFKNIANDEIQHFHKTIGVDFSISLTELLTNNLFHVQYIGNNIYRVFPLFYCKNVLSSNPNDNCDNIRCLILIKDLEHETYISFITNSENTNIPLSSSISNMKNISENLTTSEYNALVYYLRQVGVVSGNLNYSEINNIVGNYGIYIFNNVEGQLRNDEGLVINDKIKNNPITVKLTNPFFINAKYTLTCTVVSLTGANVCEEYKGEFITKHSFNVNLIENSEVALPVNNYTNDSVLLFDISINISFDIPELMNTEFTLNLTVNNNRIALGDEIILTATLSGNVDVEGYSIQFFEDSEPITNGIKTTDENGVAILTYEPTITSTHTYSCNILGLEKNVNVVVYNKNTKCSLSSDINNIRVDNDITLTGVLTDYEDNVLPNMAIKLYENNNLIDDTLETDSNGVFTKTITQSYAGIYSYRVEYEGSEGYVAVVSNIVSVNVYKYPTDIQLSSPATVYVPNYFTITGNLTKEGMPFSNVIVKLYNNDNLIDSVTTDENGDFNKNIYVGTPTNYNFKAEYEGTSEIDSASITNIKTTARKIKTYISCTPNKTIFYPNEVLTLTGSITDEFGDVLGQSRKLTLNGKYHSYSTSPYNINITISSVGTKSYKVGFESGYVNGGWIGPDHAKYEDANSDIVYIYCVKYPVTVNILDDAESYSSGDSILINVTSEDNNFNPSSIIIEFDNDNYEVTSKNSQGQFIFEIPNIIDSDNYFDITAVFNADSTHNFASNTKNIHVYNDNYVQNLVLSKDGASIIVTAENRHNQAIPDADISPLRFYCTGFSQIGTIVFNEVITDSNGQFIADLQDIHGNGTIKAIWNGIESNTINFSN